MKMSSAKKLAARNLNVGISRVKVNPEKIKEIKEAITGEDIKALIGERAFAKTGKGHSRGRARVLKIKKKKGLRKGPGTKRGTANARNNRKLQWLTKVRAQRKYVKELLAGKKIERDVYWELYNKIKGGFFRSRSHIDIYLAKK